MSGPCPNCQIVIHGPHHSAPQPQPLNPPQEEIPIILPKPQPDPHPTENPEPIFDSPVSEQTPLPPQEQSEQSIEKHDARSHLQESRPSDPLRDAEEQNQAEKSQDTRRLRGLSFLQAFFLCFVFSLGFFALGFYLGKSGSVSWEDLAQISKNGKSGQADHAPTSKQSADPEASRSIPINPLTEKGSEAGNDLDASTAKATLEAFLAAETWGGRNAYVLSSKAVFPMMAASASVHGDGPIDIKGLGLQSEHPNTKVFWIQTSKHQFPFTTALVKEGEWWLVDWLGFADFYYNRLDSFAKGREGPMTGTFRVLLKPAPGETSPLSPARCLVSTPQLQASYQVNSAADSPVRRELAEIFQSYLQGDPKNFNEAMDGAGIPLVLELSRTGAENPTLQLEDIIATGWPALTPKQIKKETSSSFY